MMVKKGYNCYDDDDDEHDGDDDDDDSEQVLGMFIGSVPTVQLQDFKMAKDLFNRPSITIIIINNNECSGRNGVGEAKDS